MKQLYLILSLFVFSKAFAQPMRADLWYKPWPASWIEVPGTVPKGYGVYKFRKEISFAQKPALLLVHVSADNRYKLYVNGKLVSLGPARGDLYFWNFETIDIAPYLTEGKNVLAALVWNDGPQKPEAQISYRTAFIMQADDAQNWVVNTDANWRCIKDASYAPRPVSVPGYYVAGPAEQVDMQAHISGWQLLSYSDEAWQKAKPLFHGLTKGSSVDAGGWMLVPSAIPQMELTQQRLKATRKAEGITVDKNFPAQPSAVTIPANTKALLLLDNGVLTNAYPTLLFSGGKGAKITIGYAEALYKKPAQARSVWDYREKGNRDEVDAKIFIGKTDSVIAAGGKNGAFTSLWWRTYRYIQLNIETNDEPLVLEDIYGHFTGYPFGMQATVKAPDPQLAQIMNIGWRTARLCAWETYMDCPYYEQLQYIGDARIQALVSFYNSGDDRLVRNALNLMDRSRIAEGITLSRYPTDLHQQIPTFSLWYIGMLHDYWRYRPDALFVQEKLAGTRQVLHFFEQYQQKDGSLKNLPYWIFSDWVPGWPRGIAPKGEEGTSAVLDIQLLWTYLVAAEMEEALGLKELALNYRKKAAQLKATVNRKYWDGSKGLYADTEEKNRFSQHANALAILARIKEDNLPAFAHQMLFDTSLAQASIYFKYYLHEAAIKAGLGNDYLKWLDKWRENITLGLTTWAEMSDVSASRSDCHAWGSSPNIELLRTVLGIDSDAPGFKRIRITPHLGNLTDIAGSMPHPDGVISASYKKEDTNWNIALFLPKNITGVLVWKGKEHRLNGGQNKLRLP